MTARLASGGAATCGLSKPHPVNASHQLRPQVAGLTPLFGGGSWVPAALPGVGFECVDGQEQGAPDLVVPAECQVGDGEYFASGVPAYRGEQHRRAVEDGSSRR